MQPQIGKIAILFHTCNSTPYRVEERHLEQIRSTAPGAQVIHCESQEEMLQRGLDCDIILNSRHLPLPMTYYSKAPRLRWIQCLMAGVDGLLIPEMQGKLLFTATKGTLKYPVTEHTIALLFALSRGIHRLRDNQREKRWEKYEGAGEIRGKTAGIIGYGAIGQQIAHSCKALGMRVAVTKRTPLQDYSGIDTFYPAEKLHELLAASDFVILITPYTPETHHMMDAEAFAAMKETAFLVNMARGKVVDTDALKAALRSGSIAGAALDVVDREPLPADDALWEMENVILSPHMAAVGPYFMDRAVDKFCENLERFQRGEPLRDQVHFSGGGY